MKKDIVTGFAAMGMAAAIIVRLCVAFETSPRREDLS
jgi:hypothetical protein